MNLTIRVSEELYRRAVEIAAAENVSVEDLFAAAFQEQFLELERLKERAAKGSYESSRRVMSKIPPAEPAEHDRLLQDLPLLALTVVPPAGGWPGPAGPIPADVFVCSEFAATEAAA
jgi:hypothetical protein